MSFSEDLAREHNAVVQQQKIENGEIRPAPRESLQEILADKESERLLGLYLQQRGNDEDTVLAEKLHQKNLSEQDVLALSERRAEFLDIKGRAESIQGRLNKDLALTIEASPELKKIAEVFGVDGIRKAFVGRMKEISFRDPEILAYMEKAFKGIDASREDIAVHDEVIDQICEQYGFTRAEYRQQLLNREKDPYALHDLLRSKMGKFDKALRAAKKC